MNIVIFGGTTEGRQLAEYLVQLNRKQEKTEAVIHVCVASEYGAQVLPEAEEIKVHVGRLEQADMQEFLQEVQADICVDATHPYAVIVTRNIYRACKEVDVPYIRVRREAEDTVEAGMLTCEMGHAESCNLGDVSTGQLQQVYPDSIYVEDIQAAADYLKGVTGNILITTGSKELKAYTQIPDYENRCFARVLPTTSVVEACTELGFTGKHLICMQGPFDLAMNLATIQYADAKYLVTKASGKNGGYDEKCEAVLAAGIHLVIIGRPEEQVEPVMSLPQVESYLRNRLEV
ncbi:MAG: precorrin-6A/cobalt-precorrin-6A reductase [Lachnospiraceae bacterium]|nr:precorrin-6A/cobalt-precorrin-6A reductase [Lachnospiraceae bacterium]